MKVKSESEVAQSCPTLALVVVVAHRLSCPVIMWDLPGPGIKPASSSLAGGFSTTRPSGKPLKLVLCFRKFSVLLNVPCVF